jgi:sulfate permease, SulP family
MSMRPSLPLATALRESLRGGYGLRGFGQDFMAALIVSLVALPLSMALAIAVGLPPQYGIYTAIVAGIVTPLLGGSVTQVSGPTAAFVVILAPIVAQHGLRGIIIAEIMAGIMLLVLAWARLGRFISFVPYPVTTGFTAGIAVVLAVLSLSDLLGLGITHMPESFIAKLSEIAAHLPAIRWPEALIGIVSLFIMFTGKHITRKLPSAILGVLAGTLIAVLLMHLGIEVATIGNRFTYETPEGIRHGNPPFPPSLHWFGGEGLFAWPAPQELKVLLMPAVVIAALAALESLLSATVADGLSRTRHDPNAELTAIGIGNILSGMASGIPATGAIARTTTNIKSGARTPLASSMHAALILLYVLALAPLISYVPMAALAALLMITAYNMSHYRQFWRILTIAPRHDIIVLLTCFGLTVFVDMVAGVSVGIMLAALLFIQRISGMTEAYTEGGGDGGQSKLPSNVLVYHISGPLFFATVERALDRTSFMRRNIDTLILDMQHVPLIDMTGLVALKNLLVGDTLADKQIVLCARPDVLAMIQHKLAHEPHAYIRTAQTMQGALAMVTPTGTAS